MKKDEADAQRLHFLKWYRKSRQGFYCSQLDDQEIAAAGFYEGIHYAIAALTGSDQAVMSRSVQRREALQRGEPMPDFTGSERPEGPGKYRMTIDVEITSRRPDEVNVGGKRDHYEYIGSMVEYANATWRKVEK